MVSARNVIVLFCIFHDIANGVYFACAMVVDAFRSQKHEEASVSTSYLLRYKYIETLKLLISKTEHANHAQGFRIG